MRKRGPGHFLPCQRFGRPIERRWKASAPSVAPRLRAIYIFALVTIQLVPWASRAEQDTDWGALSLEAFEIYCYSTHADHELIASMASSAGLPPLPDDFRPFVAAPGSTTTSAYYLAWDQDIGVSVSIGASRPNACSTFVLGVDYDQIEETLKQTYRLVLASRDDTGFQVSELHVPGGVRGAREEMYESGAIGISYPKENVTGPPMYVISYLPPESVHAALEGN